MSGKGEKRTDGYMDVEEEEEGIEMVLPLPAQNLNIIYQISTTSYKSEEMEQKLVYKGTYLSPDFIILYLFDISFIPRLPLIIKVKTSLISRVIHHLNTKQTFRQSSFSD